MVPVIEGDGMSKILASLLPDEVNEPKVKIVPLDKSTHVAVKCFYCHNEHALEGKIEGAVKCKQCGCQFGFTAYRKGKAWVCKEVMRI